MDSTAGSSPQVARRLVPPIPIGPLVLAVGAAALAGGAREATVRSARVLVNEVLYDAPGADAGAEFLEILHPGGPPLDLGDLTIERGNGARAGDWRRVWRGAAGETLAAGGRYVVGGERVVPAPDAVAELELQNGPDACRVLVDGVIADLVGWGDLALAEFYAGEPAPDVPPGTSLGRIPDGADTGSNRADFAALGAPSPGVPNRRPARLELRSPGHRSSADRPPHLVVEWLLELDRGLDRGSGGGPIRDPVEAIVRVFPCADPTGGITRPVTVGAAGSAPRAVVAGLAELGRVEPGGLDLCLTWTARWPPGVDEDPAGDTLRVRARAGPGPLLVSEFLFRPAPGEPEWVEIVNAGADTVRAAEYALADARLDPVELAGAPLLAPGDLLVVAETELAGGIESVVLGPRWPALNDTGHPIADRIRIVDADGMTSDDVAYAADWAAAGRSVERISVEIPSADAAAWTAAPLGATPGRRNGARRELAPMRGFLRIEPPLVPAGAPAPVLLQLARPLAAGALLIHALDGRLVRRFEGGDLAGRRWLIWDGRDRTGAPLPPGLYLVTVAGEPVGSGEGAGAEPAAAGRDRVGGRATFVVAP